MTNEATQKQFNDFFSKAVEEQQNPSMKEIIKRKREQRAKKEKKKYGF